MTSPESSSPEPVPAPASAGAGTGVGAEADTPQRERPEPIKAVPVRHPGRWVATVVIAVLAAMFVHLLVVNPAFNWSFMVNHMFRTPVIQGARTSLEITVLAMVIGVTLGVVAAVLRLSPNPILSGAAFLYTWFFRAVPRLVLLLLFGNLGILYSRFNFGIPFDHQLGSLFGIDFDGRFFGVDARDLLTGFLAGLFGLALSEGAYMAEIVRAGIQSVDPGQSEAAQALGLSRGQTTRRVVLPQAMRVIVPPTGNETIAMLKDTSLLAYVPVTSELFFQLEAVGSRTYQIFPMLVAACLWYLFMTSVLMVAQYFLERYFGRGFGSASRSTTLRARMMAVTAGHGKGGGG
jgi:polar amino acid transport system permease protein